MRINKKLLINLFIILAMFLTTACNNDNKEKIDDIFTDTIPEDIVSKFTPYCRTTFLYPAVCKRTML